MSASIANINNLSNIQNSAKEVQKNSSDFSSILDKTIGEVNTLQKNSDQAMSDIATGSVKDLHQAAIAIDKAELSMKLLLEVRNKALTAYKELSRTQM
jgi:flagellar hook-basal body complex protein FliE